MKIAYISRAKIPSTTASALNIVYSCKAMTELGYDVDLICPLKLNSMPRPKAEIWSFYGIGSAFKIKRIPQISSGGIFFNRCAIKNCGAKKRLVYSRDIRLLSCAVRQRLPFIWECHSPPVNDEGWALAQELVSSPCCKRVVVISYALKDCLCKRNKPFRCVDMMVAHDSVFPRRFDDAYKKTAVGKKPFSLGYIGSLHEGKGWEIIPELAKLLPSMLFHIYGGHSDQVNKMRRKWCNLKNLIFHGFVEPSAIPKVMEQFEVGLLPNRPNVYVGNHVDIGSYTSPMKLFEYMAAGKVIVASDLPVLREVLLNEENAMLVPHDDLNSWVVAIRRLGKDKNLMNRIRNAAREDAVTRYSYKVRFEKILNGIV